MQTLLTCVFKQQDVLNSMQSLQVLPPVCAHAKLRVHPQCPHASSDEEDGQHRCEVDRHCRRAQRLAVAAEPEELSASKVSPNTCCAIRHLRILSRRSCTRSDALRNSPGDPAITLMGAFLDVLRVLCRAGVFFNMVHTTLR